MVKSKTKVEPEESKAGGILRGSSKRKAENQDFDDSKPNPKKVKVEPGQKTENKTSKTSTKAEPKPSKKGSKRRTSKADKQTRAPRKPLSKSTEDKPSEGFATNYQIEDEHSVKKSHSDKKSLDLSANSTGDMKGKFVGAHVSISGGLWKSVEEAVELGARSFAMFLKGQRQWISKPLKIEDAEKFKKACQDHGFSPLHIVPHGSYLMNCGSPKEDVLQKSRDMLTDELKRCESLGLALFNFHPGSTCGTISIQESIKRIAESINTALSKTKYVIAVIENMSCQGNTIGGKFEELRAIIDQVNDKSRIGVCLDTCHAFAAGFNIATEKGYEQMMSDFDSIIGLKYLKALHINDSKGEVGCHLDRHENIGQGKIGIEAFKRVMNDPRLDGLPLVLETPDGEYAREIKMLNRLVKKK